MAEKTLLQRIKAQVGAIQWGELYALLLVTLAVPAIVWLWSDWKIALSVFVTIQVGLGLVRLRGGN